MAYDISINISASGAEAVEREFKKIEAAYKNLQNLGMNFSQASGIKSLSQDITSLVSSISNFSKGITSATSQVTALSTAIKAAASNAQALSNSLSSSFQAATVGAVSSSGLSGSISGSSGSSGQKGTLSYIEAATKRRDANTRNMLTNLMAAQERSQKEHARWLAEVGAKADPLTFQLEDYNQRMQRAKMLRKVGGHEPGLDPRLSSSGLSADATNRVMDEYRNKHLKYQSNSSTVREDAKRQYLANLAPDDAAAFTKMLQIEGNKPASMWNRIKDNVAASPFGMASLFMLRYRAMTSILEGAQKAFSVISGQHRESMVEPNFQLASIGFNAPMRAGMEANAIGLSRQIPGLTIPQYFNAAAQVGSALDVKKYGQDAVARGTRAALVFGSLSNLGPDKSGELISNTYFALKDTPEFKGMGAGKAFEKIAGSMFSAISVSGAWGPDIMKSMAHFSPMGVKAGMNLDEMLAYVSTLKTQGFHPGSAGRGGKWLFSDKGFNFMARAMLFGEGESGQDFYDVRTQEAMDDLKRSGVKPGKAKQINEDAVRYLKPLLAARMAEDPLGTLAMIGEKTKSALSKGFGFDDLKASQDFLAQFSKTFIGGGMGDIQEVLGRMRAEGGWEGANQKYDEAKLGEPGVAWKSLWGSIDNLYITVGKLTDAFKAIGMAAESITNWAERLSKESELKRGGNLNPRTNLPYLSSQKELALAEGTMGLAYSQHKQGFASFGADIDRAGEFMGYDINDEAFKARKKEQESIHLGLEKDYYSGGWYKSKLPKDVVISYLNTKRLLGNVWSKMPSRPFDKFSSWLFGSPDKQPPIRPLFGDTSGLAKKYADSSSTADALDKFGDSPYGKGLEYRDRPDLLYTQSDIEMFKKAKQANAIATLKNSQFTGTAAHVWSKTWRSILGVESIEELLNRGNYTPSNPPPVIDYKWGEGMSDIPGVPRMSQFFGDNMELPSPQKQGQALDLGPVNSSLSELVSALQGAASKINSININGSSSEAPGKPVSYKWGNPSKVLAT